MNQNALNLLLEMIRNYPRSGNSEALNVNESKLKAYLESFGIACEEHDFDGLKILYATTCPGQTPDHLFNAHMDVVPVNEPHQTQPVIKDGMLFARGANDCLGEVVCIAELLIRVRNKAKIAALFSVDEEIGGLSTAFMVEKNFTAGKSIVILDATFGEIAYAQKGTMTLQLTARGHGGHASQPWMSDNPIDKLIDGYTKLRNAWKNPTQDDMWHDSLAATVIGGGTIFNQIPDTAEMLVNIRYTTAEGKERIPAMIRDMTGLEIKIINQDAPVVLDADNDAVALMKKCHKAVLGREIPLTRMNGATDARHFAKQNIPIMMIGLDGTGAHGAHEFLRLDSVGEMLDILERYSLA